MLHISYFILYYLDIVTQVWESGFCIVYFSCTMCKDIYYPFAMSFEQYAITPILYLKMEYWNSYILVTLVTENIVKTR